MALVAMLAPAGAAFAGPITETAAIPATATDWSTAAKVGKFDPSLGTLHDIGFALTGTLHGTIGVENLAPGPSTISGNIASTISLSAPGAGQVLSVTPWVGASANLGAFDGNIDFAGPSGRTFSGLSNSQSAAAGYTVGAPGPQIPTAPYIGSGKVALPVSASATAGISGPLDLAARTRAAAGAKVTVKYGTGIAPAGAGTFAGSDWTMLAGNFDAAISLLGVQHTAVQLGTLSDQTGDWTRNVTFAPFNPALGTLISADLTLTGDLKSKLSVQNTGTKAGTYSVDQSAHFDLIEPDRMALASSEALATRSGMLAPSRGTDNFTKPFGVSTYDNVLGPPTAFSVADLADLALFSGPDPVALAVEAIGTLSAELPGNADLFSSGIEGAQVTLSYTYLPGIDPPASSAVPEPATLALLLSALAGMGVLRRRQA